MCLPQLKYARSQIKKTVSFEGCVWLVEKIGTAKGSM